MKAATIHEIKQELQQLPAKELTELCLRLSKFKKENKELLTYLLFEAHDEAAYIAGVKEEMNTLFEDVNTSQVYFAKKTLRKILRISNKYIRYTGSKTVEAELLLHFCEKLQALDIDIKRSTVLQNLYNSQIKKIKAAIVTMHEDLQYEYVKQLETISR